MVQQDRLLSDFAKGFKGPRDETGLLDAGPPADWVKQWYELEKQAHKADGATNIGGNVLQFDAETGHLTIIGQSGNVQIRKDDLLKVLSFIMSGPPPEYDPNGTANVVPGTNSQAAAWEFNPVLKERHERSLKAMEDWARASSKAYPKNT